MDVEHFSSADCCNCKLDFIWLTGVSLFFFLQAGHDIKCTDQERFEYQRGILSYIGDKGDILKMPSVVTTGEAKQRSSNILGCSRATCLVEIPAAISYEKGEEVLVTLLG